jgi:hypothetical protein
MARLAILLGATLIAWTISVTGIEFLPHWFGESLMVQVIGLLIESLTILALMMSGYHLRSRFRPHAG